MKGTVDGCDGGQTRSFVRSFVPSAHVIKMSRKMDGWESIEKTEGG